MNRKKKFLFIYLKTGGGHVAPAKAVAQYLNNQHGEETEVILYDGFENSRRLLTFTVEDGYRILQNKAKWIYEFIYALHKLKPVSSLTKLLISLFIKNNFVRLIEREKPDKIVLFHFMTIRPVFAALKRLKTDIPVEIIVTDPFSAPPIWFTEKNHNFIVFSDELKQRLLREGMQDKKINVFPFILNERFSGPPKEEEVNVYKKKYSNRRDKILLILGGGDGLPHGIFILKNILKSGGDYEVIIVCGRDKDLYRMAMELKDSNKYPNLMVYGYVDFVYELLSASDIVITKGGASSIMEILMMQKIPVVNSYLWEQEKGNVEFAVKNGLGIYESNVKEIPFIINKLFNDKALFDEYKNRLAKMQIKNGTKEVAEYLLKF